MRFLHTADWHLGRVFHGRRLLDDQAHALDGLCDIAARAQLDAVVIAGDVFDRAVPPAEAVGLLDEVLTRLIGELGLTVLMVAGNHDSAPRLDYGARLLATRRLVIAGMLGRRRWVTLEPRGRGGPVAFALLPYCEPAFAREGLGRSDLQDQDGAFGAMVEAMLGEPPARAGRRVVVGHCHAEGGRSRESERPLSVWGSGRVRLSRFEGFDYAALGHLHLPQVLADGRVHYPGSLLEYSFGEAGEDKGVSLVELGPGGEPRIERVGLSPRRRVRVLSGRFEELLAEGEGHPWRGDDLRITLEDEGPVVDAMSRLREVFPGLLHLVRARPQGVAERTPEGPTAAERGRLDEASLFGSFFEAVTGEVMSGDEEALFREVLGRRREGEGRRCAR